MRYQGRITDWKDDRGFGFITPNGGGSRVFVHVSAFGNGQRRPSVGDLVTYELARDEKKRDRAENVLYVGANRTHVRSDRPRFLSSTFFVIVVVVLGVYGWQYYESRAGRDKPSVAAESSTQVETTPKFQCEGKRYCSEMTSCQEATFYLENCPGVEIDGDHDGVPCESQWCSR